MVASEASGSKINLLALLGSGRIRKDYHSATLQFNGHKSRVLLQCLTKDSQQVE